MKTYQAKTNEGEKSWYIIDLSGLTVGRAATKVASVLRGKHRPEFTPHVDTGDFVIAVNADKVVFTGNKGEQKRYYRHSGYPGGIKEITANKLLEKRPEDVFRFAVKGMLPKNRLGRKTFSKLKVYAGPEHPHQAQQPKPLEL